MKSNELRIGNWVYWDSIEAQIDAQDILSISKNEQEVFYAPIPLTEEWAVRKLGGRVWRKTESARYFVFQADGFDLVVEPKANISYLDVDYLDTKLFINPIEFVHELQNTWERLTGGELETKE